MMRFFCLFLLICSGAVSATPVTLSFNEVRLIDLVRVLYSDIVPRSFVIDGSALGNNDVVTLNLRMVERGSVEARVRELLTASGLSVVDSGSLVRISKKIEADELPGVLVYRPRHRSVQYLLDLVQGFFPSGFGGQRQISQQSFKPHDVQPVGQAAKKADQRQQIGQAAPRDTGTNAYSFIDRNDQDAVVFEGTEKERAKLEKLLVQLDQPSQELLVKAVVYEVRAEESQGSAVNLVASILGGKLGISIDGNASLGNALKIKFSNIDAVYSALSGDKRFKLISAPVVRMRSGTSARFTAGSDVPVLSSVTYPGSGTAVQSVEYKSSGVILDLKAHAREDVTDLTIGQQISSFVATTTGVNQSPTLLKRELVTQISTSNDDVVMLGGLDESQSNEGNDGLTFLPAFLRSSAKTDQRTEIMVLLNVQRI